MDKWEVADKELLVKLAAGEITEKQYRIWMWMAALPSGRLKVNPIYLATPTLSASYVKRLGA